MTDGILLAEIQRDRELSRVRHDHRRRGPRAKPQHRLPARLPGVAAPPPAGPQAGHHLRDDRHRALRGALRRRAGGGGVRPHLPGRDAVPAGGRPRPAGRGGAGPGRRDPPGRRRAARRGAGRRARLPLRRARDPRHRRRPARSPALGAGGGRGPAALRPAVGGRAAPGLRGALRATHRPGDQRRRDVTDRSRHPVRRRPGHRSHLAVQPPAEGAAAADRADQPGQRQPAGRPVRPHVGRHLHPALLGGRTSSSGRSSPSRRSCAPTSPRSSSR